METTRKALYCPIAARSNIEIGNKRKFNTNKFTLNIIASNKFQVVDSNVLKSNETWRRGMESEQLTAFIMLAFCERATPLELLLLYSFYLFFNL